MCGVPRTIGDSFGGSIGGPVSSQSDSWEQQPSTSATRGCEQTSLPTTTSRESTQGRMWPVDGTGLPPALSQGSASAPGCPDMTNPA